MKANVSSVNERLKARFWSRASRWLRKPSLRLRSRHYDQPPLRQIELTPLEVIAALVRSLELPDGQYSLDVTMLDMRFTLNYWRPLQVGEAVEISGDSVAGLPGDPEAEIPDVGNFCTVCECQLGAGWCDRCLAEDITLLDGE